ncbi:MAG: aminotransferase class I/II-fold pyridoxal phosphate-dependent enzyme [Bacteroidetes bacterium]|nr:aminotransferase class I/II-fold pyridoxal phosphate-dependent enzyme [Bacteroidota bacterium]MBU1486017.1 aminotransferase class I/II-fold pyridoxal phosphate-dependent enzyme [Bacteroidota bacterium]MBU2267618.1 aminotransferase class I/II-fold pyridoxal phosphate-dependent enzyme [Bacteroidota bacterium]MBU2376512.1 aminotransferase class I/II-fold pyridoxal phosphate-dependent enzyme [Bacteroidota bacterium]
MINISSKLSQVQNSIFSVMTSLAIKHNAINLSQGFPDFPISPQLIKLVNSEMKKGNNQYAPMPGILSLRESISKKVEALHQSFYHPEKEITITAGGTQAIFTAIATIIRPNDEAIIFEPAYDCYAPTVKLFGGLVKSFEMQAPFYEIDWDIVKRLVTVNTKLIIINSPHNPSGQILNREDINQLIMITKNTDIAIISDEVYEHVIYDNEAHLSLSRYPILKERTFVIASFGKLFHTTGWKVGYCLAPEYLMNEFRKIHQFQVFSVNTPIQIAFNEYMNQSDSYQQLASFFQKKRDLFRSLLDQTRFTLLDCRGSYFQNVSFEKITDEKDLDFALRMVKDYKVAAVPNSSFYSRPSEGNTLRFCFAKKEETLEKAAGFLLKI